MTNKKYFSFYKKIANITLYGTTFVFIAYGIMPASAAVIQRTTPAATTATTSHSASSRMPTMTSKINTIQTQPDTNNSNTNTSTNSNNSGNNTNSQTSDTVDVPSDEIIEDKTSQFDAVLESATTGTTDASTQSLADLIRAQRAALDAAAAEEFSSKNTQAATAGLSACDSGLRSCMQEKCGSNFTKCAGDGDTIWGDKMDACRRNVTCSGEEYRLFSIEIKADRDLNAKMASYQEILDCGNSYNACIEEQCGATFNKCLGKKAGDAAIAKCASIARDCTQQDSGLAARAMEVFGTLRQDAEKQIKRDEARLYELRDTMRNRCQSLGALFDERSLDCVFTVEFWAGQPTSSLYASKKAYAGSTFDCTQGWFGVDITTFKENAYRLTREQTSATSALLGSGVGMAVGSITSGAIDRAIDRHKAEQAVKKAEKEDKEATKARKGSESETDKESDKNDDGNKGETDDKPLTDGDNNKKGNNQTPNDQEKQDSDTSANDGPKDANNDGADNGADNTPGTGNNNTGTTGEGGGNDSGITSGSSESGSNTTSGSGNGGSSEGGSTQTN